jgi:hypothetical protein
MKRIHILGALALTTSLAMPVFAQQAPTNAPNPSAPPVEGTGQGRMMNQQDKASTDSGSSMSRTDSKPHKAAKGQHAKKPRQQDAATGPTADSPSGPKGDSPSPAPKN